MLFGKTYPKQLTLSEACILAGLLHGPNPYLDDALKGDYRRIKERREVVLKRLSEVFPDRYPQSVIEKTKREPIRFFNGNSGPNMQSRLLINYADQRLENNKPGLRVYLTVDQALQKSAENAVNEKLADFDRGPYGFYNGLSYRHAIAQGLKATEENSRIQAALIAIDPKTGEIFAMVGGRNSAGEYNRAIQAKRAPASAIKPFLYLHGIKSGYLNGTPFRADTIIDPTTNAVAERYSTAGAARARVELARSDNGAAVAIGQEFGAARVKEFLAKALGINPVATEMLAIGAGKGSEVSPLELASAYTIFPNNGLKVFPKAIWAAYDNENKLKMREDKPVRVIDAGAPYIVTWMLQSVIGDGPEGQYGTAKMARQLSGLEYSVALAGKTGTSDSDLWFVGFTPRLVVVVWVGFDDNYPTFEVSKGFEGAGLPLQIWGRFMRGVRKDRPDLLTGSFEIINRLAELPHPGRLAVRGINEERSFRPPVMAGSDNPQFSADEIP